jgi:transcriptional regulator of acetoin/glycerol metabolism
MPSRSEAEIQPDPTRLDERRIEGAWERRVAGTIRSDGPRFAADPDVRPTVDESWLRSLAAGVDPARTGAPTVAEPTALDRLRNANQGLLAGACDAVARIGRMLTDTDAIAILTDHQGVILEAVGDPRTISRACGINLYLGGIWNEHAVGTNGIGSALWAEEPMFIHGREHFVERLKDWSCAAAPIRDPLDRRVIGAVDISGSPTIFRPHNIAFAAAVAGEIEAALARRADEERMRLLEALARQAPAVLRAGCAVILDRDGRVLHRIGVARLAGAAGAEAEIRPGRRLARLDGDLSPEAVGRALPKGLDCRGIEPLTVDGEVRGLAVMLPQPTASRSASLSAPRPARGPVCLPGGAAIVGESEVMREAVDLARRVARINAAVLVQGSTGVGKELFARLIHVEAAGGRDTPYVAVNCGAISKELIGGELFGHVAGGFTGAVRDGRPGKLELANGGVFCLDEIGELPLDIQPYLLRVLEERLIHRIGDTRGRPFDARLVALTNRDLRAEVAAGRFRADLYYRIAAVTIRVPPLCERGEDALLLLDHFNRVLAEEYRLAPLRLDDDARSLFLGYAWPGNVRELRNLVQRLHSLSADRRVTAADLPPEMRAHAPCDPARAGPGSLREAEKAAVLRAIGDNGGNLSRAAEMLGISRPTLYRKLRLYDIQRC